MQRLPGLRGDLLRISRPPKYSSNNPARSRIRVIRHPLEDIYVPVYAGEYAVAECAGRDKYTIDGKEYDECSPFAGHPAPPGKSSRSPIPACRSNATCARAKTSPCASNGASPMPWFWKSGKRRSTRRTSRAGRTGDRAGFPGRQDMECRRSSSAVAISFREGLTPTKKRIKQGQWKRRPLTKEIIDEIKEAGGDAFTGFATNAGCAMRSAPGTGSSAFQHAQDRPAGHLWHDGYRKRGYLALHDLRQLPPAVSPGCGPDRVGVSLRRLATEYGFSPIRQTIAHGERQPDIGGQPLGEDRQAGPTGPRITPSSRLPKGWRSSTFPAATSATTRD
jgi:hypothetical protein